MTIANVNPTNTFDEWRKTTNQLIVFSYQTFDKANAAYVLSNNAYNAANAAFATAAALTESLLISNTMVIGILSNTSNAVANAYIQNSDFVLVKTQANLAYSQSNLAINIATSSIASANDMGNTVNVFIENVAYTVANILASNGTFVNTVNSSANAAIESILNNTTFGITYTTANAGYDFANSVGNTANVSFLVTNAAFEWANAISNTVNASYNFSNSVSNVSNLSFEVTNASFQWANAISNTLNASYAVTNASFGLGNTVNTRSLAAFLHANSGFDKANNALANTTNTTFNGDFYVAGSLLVRNGALFETRQNMGTSNNFNLASANYFTKSVSGSVTLTFTNYPVSGNVSSFILELANGGSSTITWWSGIKWAGGNTPVFTTTGKDVLGFYSHDGGITWTGLLLAKDIK